MGLVVAVFFALEQVASAADPVFPRGPGFYFHPAKLIAFIVVYFIVYAAGITYLLRLMASPPHHGEQGPSGDAPTRAAGITPAAGAAAPGHA